MLDEGPDALMGRGTFLGRNWVVQCTGNMQEECSISRAKTGEPIELLFVMVSGVGPRNCALDGCAHCCNLAYMVEQLCTSAVSWSAIRVAMQPVFNLL